MSSWQLGLLDYLIIVSFIVFLIFSAFAYIAVILDGHTMGVNARVYDARKHLYQSVSEPVLDSELELNNIDSESE